MASMIAWCCSIERTGLVRMRRVIIPGLMQLIHDRAGDARDAAVAATVDQGAMEERALIWEHVNPYGRYELDMRTRIAALT